MFCSRCGKRVLDSMLFCPFCGAEIIIPDQDVTPEPARPEAPAAPEKVEEVRYTFDVDPEPPKAEAAEPPEPEAPAPEPEPEPEPAEPPKPEPEPPKPEPEPPRERPEPSPRPVSRPRYRTEPDEDEEDDYDAFEQQRERPVYRRHYGSRYEDDDDYDDFDDMDDDDDEDEGFFARHLRGIIALVLVLALLGVGAVFALTDFGQGQLAKLNLDLPLPIRAEAYSRLGYEQYQSGEFAKAAEYYERALERDPSSYNYASSAAMAYKADRNVEKATEMLGKCIEINPNAIEPYCLLLELYPDAATRPDSVTRLIRQGYQNTGDERLNLEEAAD